MPEEIILKLKKRILPEWKVCFWSAIIIGLITHLYKITNWLPNWDSLVFRYDSQNMVAMGRWFLPVASAPSSFYDLPWVTGLLSILFHALGAVCICKMFAVKKKTTAVLIGALVVSFPTVTSVMLYNYVADSYALSFLLACLAAVLITAKKPRIITASVLIALSVGIYQAYITVTIMLLLCYLILEIFKSESDVKSLIIKSGKFLLTGVIGMALYYLIFTVILKITNTTPLDYQGFQSASSLSGMDILGSLYTVKETFLNYFFDFSNGISLFGVINIAVLVFTVAFYLVNIIKQKLKISKILMLAVFAVLLPFGACVLAFVNSGIDYHNLMKMGFLVFYLLFVLEYEKTDCKCEKLKCLKSWVILGITALLVFNQIIIANVSYHKINIAYEKSYGTLIRIADRIEQTEGTEQCDSILVLGALENSEPYSAVLPPDIVGTTDGYILRKDDEIVGQSVLCSALNDYCGKNYKLIAGEEKANLIKKAEVEALENWPAKNSILVVDNIIVINLGD